jgi:hypothetical protein
MNKDQRLLQEAYEIIQIKQFLMSEGYSAEESEQAIVEGWGKDLYSKAKKGLAKAGIAAAMSTAALGGTGQAAANEVTADDIAQSIKRGGAASVGYTTPEARQKASTNINGVTYEDLVKSGEVFNLMSDKDWQEVDQLLNELERDANKSSNPTAKKSLENLNQIETKLDQSNNNNNNLNAQDVLKDVYNKVGEVSQMQPNINHQKLFNYVVSEIQSGQKYDKGTVGEFLRLYIIQHTPPKYKDGKLIQGNDYWSADKALRGN